MRLETLTVEEFNRYLQKSDFHPTAEYETEFRKRVFRKLMTSMVNAAFKKFFEKSTIKLDVTIGDTKVSDKNEATLNFKIETNEPRNDYSDHFHEIDVSKTSKITSNTSLDFDRAA